MTEHVSECEWKLYDDGSGAFCIAHHERACMMNRDDVEARLNATERLSAEDLFPEGFAIVHPNLDKLIAYANILEGKDA